MLSRTVPAKKFEEQLRSLPLAFSISGGTLEPLDFDTRQQGEVFLTAGQSLFAVAIFVSLTMSRWEALVLGGLFVTQFAFTDNTIRVGYGIAYTGLALLILLRDVPVMPTFFGAAKDAAFDPEKLAAEGDHPPPDDGET